MLSQRSFRQAKILSNSSSLTLRHSTRKFSIDNFSAITAIHHALLTIHDVSGLSWTQLIPLSTVALSIMTLPIAIQSRLNSAKIQALQPLISAQVPTFTASLRKSATASQFQAKLNEMIRNKRKDLYRRHRVNLSAMIALPALKVPIWISYSMALRSMSGLPIPYFTPAPFEESLTTEGYGWIADLSHVDSHLVLPFAVGLLNLINVEINSVKAKGRFGRVLERIMRLVSIAIIPIAGQMPAAVCLYWVSSAAVAVVQNLGLNWLYPQPSISANKDSKLDVTTTRLELPGENDSIDTVSPTTVSVHGTLPAKQNSSRTNTG